MNVAWDKSQFQLQHSDAKVSLEKTTRTPGSNLSCIIRLWEELSWHTLEQTVHSLNGAASLSIAAEHVLPFMKTL